MGILDAPGLTQAAADRRYNNAAVPSYITGTHPNGYERRRNVYNLKPTHLRKTRARLAAARIGSGLCRISFLGTSLVAGEFATPFATNAPTVRFRDIAAAAGYPIAGTGFVFAQNGQSGIDGRITNTGSWTNYSQVFAYATTNGVTKTFTSDKAGTVVDVFYNDSNSGSFTVSIDGGAADTVTLGATPAMKVKSYTGLANTTHTVVVTHLSNVLGILLAGFDVRGTSGLLVGNYGVGGSKASDWKLTNGNGYATVALTDPADCYVLDVMTNDVLQSTPDATYKADMQTIISRLKATGADVVLVADMPNGNIPVAFSGSDAAWRTRLYELADENDLPLLDLLDRWGSYTIANGLGMYANSVHANALGYAEKGAAYAGLLGLA